MKVATTVGKHSDNTLFVSLKGMPLRPGCVLDGPLSPSEVLRYVSATL